MYLYLSLVERKVAEFYHNTWLKWLVFIAFSGQFMVSLAGVCLFTITWWDGVLIPITNGSHLPSPPICVKYQWPDETLKLIDEGHAVGSKFHPVTTPSKGSLQERCRHRHREVLRRPRLYPSTLLHKHTIMHLPPMGPSVNSFRRMLNSNPIKINGTAVSIFVELCWLNWEIQYLSIQPI